MKLIISTDSQQLAKISLYRTIAQIVNTAHPAFTPNFSPLVITQEHRKFWKWTPTEQLSTFAKMVLYNDRVEIEVSGYNSDLILDKLLNNAAAGIIPYPTIDTTDQEALNGN